MQTILLGDVKVPTTRQRESMDPAKVEALKESILQEGLFHAILLDENCNLVAGGRRLRAFQELYTAGAHLSYDGKEIPFGQVPFTFTHKTDPLSLQKIELEENSRREQLSPLEEAKALANLHRLMQTMAPELVPGIRAAVTLEQTAAELGKITGEPRPSDAARISDSIIVDAYKDEPEVKRAKTFGDAVKAAKKAATKQMQSMLGMMEAGVVLEGRHKVLQGTAEERLGDVPDNCIDVIIADPPYGIGADSFGEQSKVGHDYTDDEDALYNVLQPLINHIPRICKPDAGMFVFHDIRQWEVIASFFRLHLPDWYVWPTPLIWHKPNRGHAPQPTLGPSRRYEVILYALRGDRKVRRVGSDVLTFAVPDVREHGAGKPPDLYAELLSWLAFPGDAVLDPCAGSGTIIEAAERLDCSSYAIEPGDAHAAACRDRAESILKKRGQTGG